MFKDEKYRANIQAGTKDNEDGARISEKSLPLRMCRSLCCGQGRSQTDDWRVNATFNSEDKCSKSEMSYELFVLFVTDTLKSLSELNICNMSFTTTRQQNLTNINDVPPLHWL